MSTAKKLDFIHIYTIRPFKVTSLNPHATDETFNDVPSPSGGTMSDSNSPSYQLLFVSRVG